MAEKKKKKTRFEISKFSRNSSFSMKYAHSHSFFEIFYLVSGECGIQIGTSYYTLTAGQVAIILPNIPHKTSYIGSSETIRICLEFSSDLLQPLFDYWGENWTMKNLSTCVFEPSDNDKTDIERIFNNMLKESSHSNMFSEEFTSLLFFELILLMIRQSHNTLAMKQIVPSYNRHMQTAIDYINDNFTKKMSLSEVAESLHLNSSYFSKQFKQLIGVGFSEYVANLRVKLSERMLLETNKSITEIAFECGFDNSNYYGDVFRRINHVSPSEFRKKKGNI